jgi:hypothetical protein
LSHNTSQGNAASDGQQSFSVFRESASTTSKLPPTFTEKAEDSTTDIESGELNEASFLSFEEWKRKTLEKAGQVNADIGNKRSGSKRGYESIQNNLESLGDEGEIDLDFTAFRSGGSGEDQASENKESDAKVSQNGESEKRKDQYRTSDAGKTCKERFSYASFDAGATVLKTHPGAKNSKAVLVENKDSYMLSECATEGKFIIVELSEDIWIDTVVLANYEFFSSMIRTFRVSVSDRYPVKLEKWKDLGTYEARNSRDIQAFLIENPQIWARYLKVEFLSHYGNEYYCPLSLLRVHGTRMLESWKEMEASGDEEDIEEGKGNEEHFVPDAVAQVVQEEERLNDEPKEARAAIEDLVKTAASIADQADPALDFSHTTNVNSYLQDATADQMTTPWKHEIRIFNPVPHESVVCLAPEAPEQPPIVTGPNSNTRSTSQLDPDGFTATGSPFGASTVSLPPTTAAFAEYDRTGPQTSTSEASSVTASIISSFPPSVEDSESYVVVSTVSKTANISSTTSIATKAQNITASLKNKTTGTSSASSPLPTIQESFFKAVSRRLQLLEANSTLSLKYIEEQSKILRAAFTKVEKKQLQKTNDFLHTLNSTVLAELRGFRQQYDEIWQSTIISLESQRDESRREILAISTRLNILADEVVFQKRMSIVQSLLLLVCLGFVIFSRVSAGGHLDFPSIQARARSFRFPVSPPESPSRTPESRLLGSRQWLQETGKQRQDSSPISTLRNGEDEDSPPTPTSFSSHNDSTPPSGADDTVSYTTGGFIEEHLEPADPHSDELPQHVSGPVEGAEEKPFHFSPTVRTPKRRKTFIRRQSSPSPFDGGHDGSPLQISDVFSLLSQTKEHGSGIKEPVQANSDIFDRSPPLSSPAHQEKTKERRRFSIVRKPLPDLPMDGK